jgi:hypothetical protein
MPIEQNHDWSRSESQQARTEKPPSCFACSDRSLEVPVLHMDAWAWRISTLASELDSNLLATELLPT